ncbi:recombinase family protein [Parapedobacter sp. 10938]|uniref:recombinase family protein n=1 Tax=Parapedobacter flavus TaxID=3110225 RepID=UPI002DBB8C13|nr:recombinase family protein [Parapedobacter sp. 10938]MEC3881839.1 recombinase family protein [Parapedobacter sp. 10938]
MKFGYIRVSKDAQNFDLQLDALEKYGCDRVFHEKVSGVSKERPQFQKLLEQLRGGDTVVVWRIDRLGRTTLQLIKLMVEFGELGVNFVSITEGIDTGTKMGKLWFMLSSVLAENEREVLRERTRAGLDSARARGRTGGRPKGLSKAALIKAHAVKNLYENKKLSMQQIAEEVGLSRVTCYRYLDYLKNSDLNKD